MYGVAAAAKAVVEQPTRLTVVPETERRHALGQVALGHDYLNQQGGAERVVLELTRMFPEAPLYTSLYRRRSTFPEFEDLDVRASFLDHLPVDNGFRSLLPMYPAAMGALGRIDADLLLTSSSGWAHGMRVRPGGRTVVYCHNPARWLYGEEYLGASATRQRMIGPLRPWLRRWDLAAARRADAYVANSRTTQSRIKACYGIDSTVVHPPVEVRRFTPTPRGERLLVVSRLLPYKRVGLVVEAATKAGVGLDVVGTGPELDRLKALAGPGVTFHGRAEDWTVTQLMQNCRAFCLPGVEDFGITAVEAQAAGKPVIALSAGGALETVDPGTTGVFFNEPTHDAFLDALRTCDDMRTDPHVIAMRSYRFSPGAFRVRLLEVLERVCA